LNLLAIDTACSVLSIAVSREDEIFCAETEAVLRHSEIVMNMIDSHMKKASLSPSSLDGVICMGGPGSFTGLRIGYSIAKGLALSLSVPFIAVPTLDCMAFARRSGFVLPAIEARKNSWFFSIYNREKIMKPAVEAASAQISDEIIKTAETEKEKIILTGSGSASLFSSLTQETVKHLIYNNESRGYASELIAIVKKQNLLDNDNSAILYSGPEYIRKTDAELNLR
jgi:tRNA threonylcarbamoyladenosine biosynthesis protein TsaB